MWGVYRWAQHNFSTPPPPVFELYNCAHVMHSAHCAVVRVKKNWAQRICSETIFPTSTSTLWNYLSLSLSLSAVSLSAPCSTFERIRACNRLCKQKSITRVHAPLASVQYVHYIRAISVLKIFLYARLKYEPRNYTVRTRHVSRTSFSPFRTDERNIPSLYCTTSRCNISSCLLI